LLWSPGARPRPSSLVVANGQWSGDTCTMQWSGTGSSREPLEVENGLVEPNPKANPPKGLYIARTLVWDCQDIPVRVLNATHCDQKLKKGSSWHTVSQSHWWPHPMWNNHRCEILPRSYRTWL
jgi:hypothetical protein